MFSGENDHIDVFDDGDVDIRILIISRKFDGWTRNHGTSNPHLE